MKETMMFKAVKITSTGVVILRVSNSKNLLNEYLIDYIDNFHGWGDVKVISGENCYTILGKYNNAFIAAFKIRNIACIEASPEELEDEKRDSEETAKNAE